MAPLPLLPTLVARDVAMATAARSPCWEELLVLDAHLAPLRERLHQGGAALSEDLMAGGPTAGRALLRRCHALDAEIRAGVNAYLATRRPPRAPAGPPAHGD